VESPVLMILRFGKPNSSIQVGYHPTFSTEGDALGKVVGWPSNVDCLVEVGTPIRITHRNQVRGVVIQLHNCGFQYESGLKTER